MKVRPEFIQAAASVVTQLKMLARVLQDQKATGAYLHGQWPPQCTQWAVKALKRLEEALAKGLPEPDHMVAQAVDQRNFLETADKRVVMANIEFIWGCAAGWEEWLRREYNEQVAP